MTSESDPPNLFVPVWAAIGEVASAYGGVEIQTRNLLTWLLGDTPEARIAAHALPTDAVIKVCTRIIRETPRFAAAADLSQWILKACQRAGDERANIAHGAWHLQLAPDGEVTGVRWPARGDSVLHATAEELRQHALAMMGLTMLVSNIEHMLDNAIASSAYEQEPSSGPMRGTHNQLVQVWGLRPFFL